MLRRRLTGSGLPLRSLRGVLWWSAGALALASPCVAQAQTARRPAAGANAQPAPAITNTLVRNHFESGTAYFEVGRFADAEREFELAYDLSPQPEFLLNLGRARESAGNDPGALDAYQRFLSAGAPGFEVESRDALTARVTALRARIAERARPTPPPPPPARPAPEPTRGVAHVVGPVVLFVGAGTLGGLAVWQGLQYRAAVGALDRANRSEQPWNNEVITADLGARRSGALTVAFAAGGGALLAGGVVWLIASTVSAPRTIAPVLRARVTPWTDGASLGLAGAF